MRAVVLAAGAGRRFGGPKQLAPLEGRPLLGHVLDALAAAGVASPLVVVRPEAPAVAALATGAGAEVVVNPRPDEGLSSSLRCGWLAALGDGSRPSPGPVPDAVLVVLGDQPRLRPSLVRALLEAPLDPGRPIVAPRYATGGGRNPVRVERSAGALVLGTTGDRGLGPLIDARPDLVRSIDVPGTNPDVDRPADLDAAAGVPRDAPGRPPTELP